MKEATCTTEQRVAYKADPVSTSNRQVPLTAPVTVKVLQGDGTFDETHLIAGSLPGDTEYLIEGKVDLGAGQFAISRENVVLHVTGAFEADLGITLGIPEVKAAPGAKPAKPKKTDPPD